METISAIFTVDNIIMMNIGVAAGIIIGAMPGLSVAFAVTVLLTMTFHMESLPAMYLMLGAYCGGLYGGSITATLINTPGTANAVCTALEGYPLARRGRAGDALKCALVASTIGGLISCVCLLFFAPQLAKIILKIQSPEYFALCAFGIFAAIGLEGTSFNNIVKGLISAAFGLLLSCVGSDPCFGTNRFSFDSYYMLSGIKVVSSMLGAYAMCQVLVNCSDVFVKGDEALKVPKVDKANMSLLDILKHWRVLIKSSLIGAIVGAVPGTGGAESAMIAYNEAKRSSKHPEEFGKGSIEGVLAAESANNATSGGAMIPMLTLGIPGDTVMAILLSALTMQGITPGANLFTSDTYWVNAITEGIRVLIGAEVEYDPKRRDLAITAENAEKLDYLIFPNSHTHMVMPREYYSDKRKMCEFMLQAFMDIMDSPLRSHVVSMAHPFCAVCCPFGYEPLLALISDEEYKRCYGACAENKIAVEINLSKFRGYSTEQIIHSNLIRPFQIAKACGCKFTFGSDSHTMQHMDTFKDFYVAAELLELSEEDISPFVRQFTN